MKNFKVYFEKLKNDLSDELKKDKEKGMSLYPAMTGYISALVDDDGLTDSQKLKCIRMVIDLKREMN